MKFSQLLEAVGSDSTALYHITPTSNVKSILNSGIRRFSPRSTCGVETQKKIYLTNSLENIEDPFPHHFGWMLKDMSVFKVNIEHLRSMLEVDPEYDSGSFFMINKDIAKSNLELLGRYKFVKKGELVTGKPYIGD